MRECTGLGWVGMRSTLEDGKGSHRAGRATEQSMGTTTTKVNRRSVSPARMSWDMGKEARRLMGRKRRDTCQQARHRR